MSDAYLKVTSRVHAVVDLYANGTLTAEESMHHIRRAFDEFQQQLALTASLELSIAQQRDKRVLQFPRPGGDAA